ncbi:2phosphodiesteraselike [Caligus rogercresseyi]|uniref:2phosphodiesteraselike n=1 Tax=Caligus rogercresseyi TaxID=217165 RepID=A0A7T8KB99_CALRO|nr:2phosphodiesteraselike [Caligus rogercresseyi]
MSDPVVVYKYLEDEDRFYIHFHLKTDSLDRELISVVRRMTTDFLVALSHKIDKIKDKKSKKKKKSIEVKTEEASPVSFCLESKPLETSSEELATHLLSKAQISLDICGTKFRVDKNPPFVDTLRLPNRIMVGFPCYPSKFEVSNGQREASIFNWLTSDNLGSPNKWSLSTENNYVFTPQVEDAGKFVKLEVIPKNEVGAIGRTAELISKVAVDSGPGLCPFQKRQETTQNILSHKEVRVLSYNIWRISMQTRITLAKSSSPLELIGYNADIMCLQEVDRKVYKHDLLPLLRKWVSIAYSKPREETLLKDWHASGEGPINVMNELLKGEDPTWNDLREVIKAKPDLEDSIMKRKTAFLTVVLQPKENPSRVPLVVGNSHLFFQPDADHIRLLQAEMCLRHFGKVLSEHKGHLLFCGDFNSVPSNAVYEYFLGGNISKDHDDWRSCRGQEVEGLSLSHGLSLDSGCGTPQYTNYTQAFKDCLDYIFYDKKGFLVDKVIPFPATEELGEALPNVYFPSDHLACIVDLKWKY